MTSVDPKILPLLQCPETKKDLQLAENQLLTSDGKKAYPIIDGLPWLLKNPEFYKIFWSKKKSEFLSFHENSAKNIGLELREKKNISLTTRTRLEVLKKAHETNHLTLKEILKNLASEVPDITDVVAPSHQSLHLYRKNIFRDWGWKTEENKRSVDLITEIAGLNWTPKNLCVLGSGASRLAMDVHKEFHIPMTLAIDFNPLLLLVAQKMLNGQTVSLYDFAAAPVEMDSVARLYNLKSDLGSLENFHLVCADVTDLPFKPKQFGAVLTPWLIDIVPFDFKRMAQRVNQMLEIGGQWLNFGPLGFSHQSDMQNLTRPEIIEQLKDCGFEIEIEKVERFKYLSSEDEVNSRNETVFLFKANKVNDVAVESFNYMPSWLTQIQSAIPLSEEILKHQQLLRFQADLFHSIDGRNSIQSIAQLFAAHYKMPVDTALVMTMNVLRQFEESLKRKS